MATPAIKICGIRGKAALDAAIKARADYAGLVFYPPSPRNVTPGEARLLGEHGAGRIRLVGLFVNADDSLIAAALEAAKFDCIQLHGQETPKRASEVRNRFGLPVWKAVSISSAADTDRAKTYIEAADLILFDAKTPKGALPGGMGLTFDWGLVKEWRNRWPWGLAGGLTPDNIATAIRETGAPLVDTSSGVESAPGIKDVDRIAAFAYAARHRS